MALQPKQLREQVDSHFSKVCDGIEIRVDVAMKKSYRGGVFTFDLTRQDDISHEVLLELRRRYAGWTVAWQSWSDCRDGDSGSYLLFTPRPESKE